MPKIVNTPIQIDMTQKELGEFIGVEQGTVSRWLHRKVKIPAWRCKQISELTGVPLEVLRPDVF